MNDGLLCEKLHLHLILLTNDPKLSNVISMVKPPRKVVKGCNWGRHPHKQPSLDWRETINERFVLHSKKFSKTAVLAAAGDLLP